MKWNSKQGLFKTQKANKWFQLWSSRWHTINYEVVKTAYDQYILATGEVSNKLRATSSKWQFFSLNNFILLIGVRVRTLTDNTNEYLSIVQLIFKIFRGIIWLNTLIFLATLGYNQLMNFANNVGEFFPRFHEIQPSNSKEIIHEDSEVTKPKTEREGPQTSEWIISKEYKLLFELGELVDLFWSTHCRDSGEIDLKQIWKQNIWWQEKKEWSNLTYHTLIWLTLLLLTECYY